MFWLDGHVLRASSSTVWACTSKRPAIARISCGSVIKRVGISFSFIYLSCLGLMRPAAKASPTSHPPAGVRVSTFTDAVLAACVPMPRPFIAPMRAWVYGLVGKFADVMGDAILLAGNIGAALTISGADCAQPFGTDMPPSFPAPAR